MRPAAPSETDDVDPLTVVASEISLPERLLQDLGTLLVEADIPIAEQLVGAPDATGYFRGSLDEIAWNLEVEVESVGRVLGGLQSLDRLKPHGLRACFDPSLETNPAVH